MADQRRTPRADLDCPVTLVRRRGAPIAGHTEDVGPGGARIVADRPLSIDEELAFDLELGDLHVAGRARVVRQHGLRSYGLRFERLDPAAAAALAGACART
jgi:hypothetical protein